MKNKLLLTTIDTVAYLYRWTEISTGMWYEGSRTAKGCHPNDGYLCSSKIVNPLIKQNPDNWIQTILVIGEPKYIRNLEEVRLKSIDAKNDPTSYNKDNADGKFSTVGVQWSPESREKRIHSMVGKKRKNKENYIKANQLKSQDPEYRKKLKKPKRSGHGANVSKATRGKPKSDEHRLAMSVAKQGKPTGPCSQTRKDAIRLSQKGKPCNNPIVTCPHCGKSGYSGAMKLWHFDKCKMKDNK